MTDGLHLESVCGGLQRGGGVGRVLFIWRQGFM